MSLTSSLRFLSLQGESLDAPPEWTPALVEACLPPELLGYASLTRQGQACALSLRSIGGTLRILAEWPRSGAGKYDLQLCWPGGVLRTVVQIPPRKISLEALKLLLNELDNEIPHAIAVGLRQCGGLAGVVQTPPNSVTLAADLERLGAAIEGRSGRPGLLELLPRISADPHRVLVRDEPWVRRAHARRPHPARLWAAMARAGNLDANRRPETIVDIRVEHTYDVYENRLVRLFVEQVDRRLRDILQLQVASTEMLTDLRDRLRRCRGRAQFLQNVSLPDAVPDRVTMVLLRRPSYRQLYERFLEFRRTQRIQLEDPILEAPLDSIPRLYQRWASLKVVQVLLQVAAELGYRVRSKTLVLRRLGQLHIQLVSGSAPVLVLEKGEALVTLRLEPVYGKTGILRSLTFEQKPDIVLEVTKPGRPPQLWLFDPKYKLAGQEDLQSEGKPTKDDIDKMHAYRDAIRDVQGQRVVRFASILYPGLSVPFAPAIQAIGAVPGRPDLHRDLHAVLEAALGTGTDYRPPACAKKEA